LAAGSVDCSGIAALSVGIWLLITLILLFFLLHKFGWL
jgi:hypothetical protein